MGGFISIQSDLAGRSLHTKDGLLALTTYCGLVDIVANLKHQNKEKKSHVSRIFHTDSFHRVVQKSGRTPKSFPASSDDGPLRVRVQ